ncbi:MAG: hypothetical protein WDO69_07130 [Pseudomonadota bacterium]
MSRNKVLAIMMALGLSASLYACGSDDDTNPGGEAGAAGNAGKGGSGGKAGAGTGGGTAGKGGTPSAGGSDVGDSGAGGTGATGATGDSGAGGMGATGGEPDLAAGSGGEGGAPPAQTLTEACTTQCDPAHTVATCSTTLAACIAQCTVYPVQLQQSVTDGFLSDADAATLNQEYLATIQCQATHLTSTDQYMCAADGTMVSATSPVESTVCETLLCKWTCDDGNFGTAGADVNVYTRCGC